MTREVEDLASDAITVPADYDVLGGLVLIAMALCRVLPLVAVVLIKVSSLRRARTSDCLLRPRAGGCITH